MDNNKEINDARIKNAKESSLWNKFELACRNNNIAEQTIKTYKNAYKSFFSYLYRNKLSRPTIDDFKNYVNELEHTHKHSTVHLYTVALRLFFSWSKYNHIYPNITEGFKESKVEKIPKKGYLSVEMATQLLASIGTVKTSRTDLRDYLLLSLILICGLRASEICNLNWEDLVIRDQTWVLVIRGKVKSKNPEFVVVPESLLDILMDYRSKIESNLDSGPMLTSLSMHNTFGRLTPRSVSRICKTRLKEANLDLNLSANSLRFTSIILALKNGKSLEEVQQAARHKNIESTAVYKRVLKAEENTCATSIAESILSSK